MAKPVSHFNFLALISMVYISTLTTSALLSYKYIMLGPVLTSAAIFVIPITYFLSDVVTEVYGYQYARQMIWSGLVCLFLVSAACYLLAQLPTPAHFAKYSNGYQTILDPMMRIFIANALAIFIGSFVNIFVISKWKILVQGRIFWLRSLGSSMVGEGVFTVLVVFFVNAGIVSTSQLIVMMLVSFAVKVVFDFLAVGPAALLASYLKSKEKVNHFDLYTNFNPFRYFIDLNQQSEAPPKGDFPKEGVSLK